MDRISAARVVLAQRRYEVDLAARNPCIRCRFYELACIHPSIADVQSSPETGRTKLIAANPNVARSELGACGPEGALFTPRGAVGSALVRWLASPAGIPVSFLAVTWLVLSLAGY